MSSTAAALPYKLRAIGDMHRGEWDEVMHVFKQCHEVLAADCSRIACTIKMDWRKGHAGFNREESKKRRRKSRRALRK